MNVGIDKINFFVPPYYLDMTKLAEARKVDPAKFHIGIGQDEMAINPKTQDIITFAVNACKPILTKEDLAAIDMVILGTESSFDESKSAAVILHRLLKIQPFARSFEIKEACYAATAGLQMAKNHILSHPEKKVLVVASDIARYGLNSGGEPTQGAGAVAMLISQKPRILALEDESVALTQDIYDFWRPSGYDYPLVDGPLSNQTYIQSFEKLWQENKRRHQRSLKDYTAIVFHTPYTKMGKKALSTILENEEKVEQKRLLTRYEESIGYSRRIGNLYTASLYLALISLLETSTSLKAGDRLGLFSYGSGAVAEFFSGTLVADFEKQLLKKDHPTLLNQRQELSVDQYENIFNDSLNSNLDTDFNDPLPYSIEKIKDSIRYYRRS